MIQITQLHIYPVKSMQGISLDEAELTVRGLNFDRNWMVVENDGSFLTQRRMPELAAIRTNITDEHLQLTNKTGDSFHVPLHKNHLTRVSVEVWGDQCSAFDEGDEVSEWISASLGLSNEMALRLVRFNKTFRREVDREFLDEEDSHTAFADGFPFLVTSEASLESLNDQLLSSESNPVAMDRFRPNIVIKGLAPFRENSIDILFAADGGYVLGIRKPCKRCKVTTVDQQSGAIAEPKEPLRTLTRMQTVAGLHGAFFGQNATLLTGEGETIRVGDYLKIESPG